MTFTADDVVWFITVMDEAQIDVWLDGGWGVDALVGTQTREHDDLDIALHDRDDPTFRAAMREHGFDTLQTHGPYNYVVSDAADRRIDVHLIEGIAYDPGALDGHGTVLGRAVRCCTAEFHLLNRTRYEPAAKDLHDIAVLRNRLDS